jgi:hypothetical protein
MDTNQHELWKLLVSIRVHSWFKAYLRKMIYFVVKVRVSLCELVPPASLATTFQM